jgi:hypothetical protein
MFCNHNVSRDGSSLVIRWNLLCWVWSIELAFIGGDDCPISITGYVVIQPWTSRRVALLHEDRLILQSQISELIHTKACACYLHLGIPKGLSINCVWWDLILCVQVFTGFHLHTSWPEIPPRGNDCIYFCITEEDFFLSGECNSLFMEQLNLIFIPLAFGMSHTPRHIHISFKVRCDLPPCRTWTHKCAVQTTQMEIKKKNERKVTKDEEGDHAEETKLED